MKVSLKLKRLNIFMSVKFEAADFYQPANQLIRMSQMKAFIQQHVL